MTASGTTASGNASRHRPVMTMFDRGPDTDPALMDRYRQAASSAVSDAQEFNAAAVGILPIGNSLANTGHEVIVGPALTARIAIGDNLALHKALDQARPGDVVVVDARGDITCSVLGEIVTAYATSRGVAALVVDGAVRDVATISRGSTPVFACGVSPLGPTRTRAGEVHGPVGIGGVVVHDGDLIVADADGVTVVPWDRRVEVIERTEAILAREANSLQAIADGTWDRSWVDPACGL